MLQNLLEGSPFLISIIFNIIQAISKYLLHRLHQADFDEGVCEVRNLTKQGKGRKKGEHCFLLV